MRWLRLAPVTAESLMICAAVFVSCSLQAILNHERFEDVQREWGAIQSLDLIEIHDGIQRVKELELTGPFDVWDGQWWRIPTTVFHHGDLLHLVLVGGAVWYLGRRLESRWGRLGMALFLPPAICLPVLAELSLGQASIGLSGLACAMLGALVVLRRFDSKVAAEVPREIAQLGMLAIVVCWLATLSGYGSLMNAAHATGFSYGALIAWTFNGPGKRVMMRRGAVVLAHLALLPVLFSVTRPVWIGRYHWYQALSIRTSLAYEDLEAYEQSLDWATRCDPSLIGAWLQWSLALESHENLAAAWKRTINGLVLNPSSQPLIENARRLWRHLDSEQRRDAERILARFFGARSEVWLSTIRAGATVSSQDSNEEVRKFEDALDIGEFSLHQQVELRLENVFPAQPNQQAPMDPVDGNDAVEGETL